MDTLLKQLREHFRYGDPMYYELLLKIAEIHNIKNKGYGGDDPLSNFMESKRFGVEPWKGCLVRMSDKWSRICNLARKMDDPEYRDAVQMESLEDTLLDLANYALLCVVLLKRGEKSGCVRRTVCKCHQGHQEESS